jgi:hypothetical protein
MQTALRRRDLPCRPRRAPPPAPGHPGGDRGLAVRAALLGALALAGCQGQDPPAGPPPEPPSGPIRPGEPIPYATLAEHLRFNTKSRMQLMRLCGRVVHVHGPAWKIEPAGPGALLHLNSSHQMPEWVNRESLGTARGSCVRAYFADPADLRGVREGREVDVVGRFAFRGDHVLLEEARLGKDKGTPSRPAH